MMRRNRRNRKNRRIKGAKLQKKKYGNIQNKDQKKPKEKTFF